MMEPASVPKQPAPRTAQRVLVVDDDEDLLFNLGTFLETQGYSVVCVQDIAGAVASVATESVDVALVDYLLARQSGIDVIRALRDMAPGCPIILMSAYLDDWVQSLVGGIEPLRCMRKPFAGSELLNTIERLLLESAT